MYVNSKVFLKLSLVYKYLLTLLFTLCSSKKDKLDIFGLRHERDDECDGTSAPVLSTFFVTRIANGSERRTANTSGQYYIDLKVYQTNDARETDSQELWKKALLRIKFQTEGDTSQWRKLQAFVQSADELFVKPPLFNSI